MIGFAQKIGMTRLFIDGKAVPVTVLKLPKNFVAQRKTKDTDGYEAVQLCAFPKRTDTNPVLGHVQKYLGQPQAFHCIGEFKISLDSLGSNKQTFDINDFQQNDLLKVVGRSIGRGFAGVVKRHGFAGQPKSHGHDHDRAPGSIGARTFPGKVFKGMRMAGHYGNSQVTVTGLRVVAIDPEQELLFVSGSVPGANKAFVKLQKMNK
jgi:50S ribosomal protein L3, bacterial